MEQQQHPKKKLFSNLKHKVVHDVLKDDKRGITLGEISNRRLMVTIAAIFVLYLIFDADSSIRVRINTERTVLKYKQEAKELQDEIMRDSLIIDGIKNNREYLIRYARENLYMVQDNEEIFIVE